MTSHLGEPSTVQPGSGNISHQVTRTGSHKLWHLGAAIHWASLDAFFAFGSMYLAFHLSPAVKSIEIPNHISISRAEILFSGIAFVMSYALGVSHYPNLKTRFKIFALISLYLVVVLFAFTIVVNFIFYQQVGRYIVGISGISMWLACMATRLLWYERVKRHVHRVLVLSDSYELGSLEKMLSASTFPIEVVARHVSSHEDQSHSPFSDILEAGGAHEVLVHGQDTINSRILLAAMDSGVTVSTFDTFSERHFFKIPSAFLTHAWFFQIDLKRHHPFYTSTKRVIDIGAALLGGVVTFPLLLTSVVLIKLTSRGPAFYSQVRVGYGQKSFTIWKLRSMRVDSEMRGPEWAKVKDPRVTAIGRLLRLTRIDELPQFWNILVGDMSFIGPRPERPEFVEQLAAVIPYYRQRHLIKPGLTGWAQICYRYGASTEDSREKLSYDLYYLKNASWMLDIQIVLQTIGAIAKGAR
ncbi:MAG: exopolysaccharide biosynthesis polyprenyl glycosylphosphotransferase [Nibricoccus sp.]